MKNKLQHPESIACLCSKLNLIWVYFVVSGKDWVSRLEKYEPLPRLKSKEWHLKIKNNLRKETSKTTSSLLFTAFKVSISSLYVPLFCRLIILVSKFIVPSMIKILLSELMFKISYKSYIIAVIIGICSYSDSMLVNYVLVCLMECSVGLKSGLGCCIYEKVLKMELKTLNRISPGTIMSIFSTDLERIPYFFMYFTWGCGAIVSIFVVAIVVWVEHGFLTGFTCLTSTLFIVSLQCYLSLRQGVLRSKIALASDKRINFMNEIITGIQTIKIQVWENYFASKIERLRKNEIFQLMQSFILTIIIRVWSTVGIKIVLFLVILVAKLDQPSTLNEPSVMNLISLIFILDMDVFYYMPEMVFLFQELMISLDRIREILDIDETNADFCYNTDKDLIKNNLMISVKNASCSWELNDTKIEILENINLSVKKSETIGVCGAVGSGKSTLCLKLLEELKPDKGAVSTGTKKSYMPQEPWLFNASIRDNILFESKYDENKYKRVIWACALEQDLKMLSYGENTIVGDKGRKLSGGQKARVTLARCLYRDADIYILDDPFSALDKTVAEQIMNRCILTFLKDKTVFLITHQIQFLQNLDQVFVLKSGKLVELDKKSLLEFDMDEPQRVEFLTNIENQEFRDEECKLGMSGWKTYKDYFKSGSVCLFLFSLFLFCVMFSLKLFMDKKLNDFASFTWSDINLNYTIIILGLIVLVDTGRQIIYYINICLCSINLHNEMFKKVLSTGMNFFNLFPKGRIMNRFSKDLGLVDSFLYLNLEQIIIFPGGMLFSFALAMYKIQFLIAPFFLLCLSLYFIVKKMIGYASVLKRIESNTASPIFEYLDSSLNGLTTIRCFKKENKSLKIFYKALDKNLHYFYLLQAYNLFATRIFFLPIFAVQMITTFACIYFSSPETAFIYVLAITYLTNFKTSLINGLETFLLVDGIMTSVERIKDYCDLESESNNNDKQFELNPDWPCNGDLQLINVSMKYDKKLSNALSTINLKVKSGQKIGVVGRTGAGKSSLMAAFLQLYIVEGKIILDNVDLLRDVPLNKARSVISAIPQVPILFTGSLRSNLDPLNLYTDDEIWISLQKVHLAKKIANLKNQLDSELIEGGKNLSIGERQLLCLARALLKHSYFIIIDEATANVDMETDAKIQKVLKNEFKYCTIFTIAHRLNTIWDSDLIIVMKEGEIVEQGTAEELKNQDGIFRKLASNLEKS